MNFSAVASGFLFWGLLEYGIHGFLCHRWKTFASPMHWAHHSEPRRIFTSPIAVMPIALLIFAIAALAMGAALASAFVLGTLLGFANYERTHWRIHFRQPQNSWEQRLRNHHLAHHECDTRAYHGVTTRIWDRVFGTLPANWRDDYLKVADRAPLTGPSNFAQVWNPKTTIKHITRVPKGYSFAKRGVPMYIAMNRFRIAPGHENGFEELWRKRDSHLDQVPGFREFHLLKGSSDDEATLYASHTVWDSLAAFEAWRDSENFRKAHAQARAPQGMYLGHPHFEGFEAVL